MKNEVRNLTKNQKGFTLIELVVVIAILGILAAIAVPLITNYLSDARRRAYDADVVTIQAAVDSYLTSASNVKYLGKRQYPIKAQDQTGALNTWTATDSSAALTSPGNPNRGSAGGQPTWKDADANGTRDGTEENLNAEQQSLSTTYGGWAVVQVTRQGTNYAVDTRDFFVDFDRLVTGGYIDAIPGSASTDNKPTGSSNTYSGSYSWYVDSAGKIKSLFYYYPTTSNSGYQNVHP